MKFDQPLPSCLASAIPSIRWPLGPSSCPPIYLEPLSSMKDIRQKQQPQSDLLRLPPSHELVSNLPFTLDELLPPGHDPESRSFGLLSIALILLGNGLTEEAHSLVTPMSWPEDTHFGFGPSVYTKVSPTAKSFATYVHCLVHRREAFNTGEFGMVGFQNANYWSNAVKKSTGAKDLPHADWFQQIGQTVAEYQHESSVQNWAADHEMRDETNDYFESRAVHQLCATVLQQAGQEGANVKLQEFAERAAEIELRVLLAHALQLAGYDCSLDQILKSREESNLTKEV
jgi:hypothetical protein